MERPMTRPHLDDGALLTLLDGEAEGAERASGEAHLRACAGCRARMDLYRTRRDRLAILLSRADFPVPASSLPSPDASNIALDDAGPVLELDEFGRDDLRPDAYELDDSGSVDAGRDDLGWDHLRSGDARPDNLASDDIGSDDSDDEAHDPIVPITRAGSRTTDASRAGPGDGHASASPDATVIPMRRPTSGARWMGRPWLRAAAVILLLAGAVVVATPARAWIAHFFARVADDRTPPAPRPAPTPATSAPVALQPSAMVRFIPSGGELTVEVAHAQTAGTLTLVPVEGAAALAEVLAREPVEMMVGPTGGLRIRNTAGTVADYRVQVPEGARRVRVRVGGGREAVVERGEIGGAGRIIPLARGR